MRRFLLGLPVLFSLFACVAVSSGGVDKNEKRKITHPNIEVSIFEAKKNVEVPPDFLETLAKELPHQLTGTNKFKHIFSHGDTPADMDGPALQLTGTLIEFNSGSRAMRYLVGFGAGAAEVVANVKLTEMATMQAVLERDITVKMKSGMYGGSTKGLADQLAKEIARVVKREPFQER